jgi:hypothetical protein
VNIKVTYHKRFVTLTNPNKTIDTFRVVPTFEPTAGIDSITKILHDIDINETQAIACYLLTH